MFRKFSSCKITAMGSTVQCQKKTFRYLCGKLLLLLPVAMLRGRSGGEVVVLLRWVHEALLLLLRLLKRLL